VAELWPSGWTSAVLPVRSLCVYILGSVELSLYLEIFMKDYAFHCEFLLLMASDEFLIGS